MMAMNYDLIFVIASRFAMVFGFVFALSLFPCRKRIDHTVLLYVAEAVITVTVGCRLCHVWLGANFSPYCEREDFWDVMTTIFTDPAYIMMLYLFTALTAHFMIYACGRTWVLARTRQLTKATALHLVTAAAAMACTILTTYSLWYGQYSKLIADRVQWANDEKAETEMYLTKWIEEEPESPHANLLYNEFMREKDGR